MSRHTALLSSHRWVKCLSSSELKGHSILEAGKSNYMAHVLAEDAAGHKMSEKQKHQDKYVPAVTASSE